MAVKIKQVQHRAEVNAKKQAQGQNKSRVSEQNASYIDRVLYLQRTVGNREVTRMLRSGDLQSQNENKKPNYILVSLSGGDSLQREEGGQPVGTGSQCTPAP